MSRRDSAAALSSIRSATGRPAWCLIGALLGSAALVAGCGDPAEAQGGPPQGPPPVSVAPAVQRAVAESEEFSGRLEATELVELRPRVVRRDRQGALHRRRDGPQGRPAVHDRPAPVRGRGRARTGPARGVQGARRTGAERARPCHQAARLAGRVAPGIRPARIGLADDAGRHPGRRGGAAGGPPEPRIHAGAGADLGPRLAGPDHDRQRRQRPVGADDDRRRRQGLRLLRRQRADLPAPEGGERRQQGAAGAPRPRQRAGLSAHRPGRLRRQPAQSADRRDPPARELRQREGPVHARAEREAADGGHDHLRRGAGPRSRDRHRPDQEVRLRRRRRTASRSSARSSRAR